MTQSAVVAECDARLVGRCRFALKWGMTNQRFAFQPDLFAQPRDPSARTAPGDEPPPADFIARIRDELTAALARVRIAETLPWPDLTITYLAELRFNSVAGWLPAEEAMRLRAAFAKEMARLDALAENS